jgi:hypothetical protein
MNTNNPLVGQFYFGFKQEVNEIVAQVNRDHMLVAQYGTIGQPVAKYIVPLSRLQGYKLYPSIEAMMEGVA